MMATAPLALGFGRIVTLEKETPDILVNMVYKTDERWSKATMVSATVLILPLANQTPLLQYRDQFSQLPNGFDRQLTQLR